MGAGQVAANKPGEKLKEVEETPTQTIRRLRAASPFKRGVKRIDRQKQLMPLIVNRKLNTERADCRAIEFGLKRTFGI